jgi:hypothetical protein
LLDVFSDACTRILQVHTCRAQTHTDTYSDAYTRILQVTFVIALLTVSGYAFQQDTDRCVHMHALYTIY